MKWYKDLKNRPFMFFIPSVKEYFSPYLVRHSEIMHDISFDLFCPIYYISRRYTEGTFLKTLWSKKFLSLLCQSWMVITTLFQIILRKQRPSKSDWNCLNIQGIKPSIALYFYKKHIRHQMMNKSRKTILRFPYFFTRKKQFLWCDNRLLWNKRF